VVSIPHIPNASSAGLLARQAAKRDIISKQPFNEEMKELAQSFANVLKPMINTVDRFGLKAYHLRRHKDSVNGFMKV
jgi:hypothetical protein